MGQHLLERHLKEYCKVTRRKSKYRKRVLCPRFRVRCPLEKNIDIVIVFSFVYNRY